MEMQFAYGSNMDVERLKKEDKGGIVRILNNAKRARLDDWEFGFTKKGNDGGKANIIPKTGGIVWGILIQLDSDAVKEMDDSEGINPSKWNEGMPHYTKGNVRVVTDDGEEHECKTYVANFHPLRFDEGGVPPSRKYLGYVVKGAKDFHLPSEYIERISNTLTKD
jgi:hypothetical protein